jgi:hypothetical protein
VKEYNDERERELQQNVKELSQAEAEAKQAA